jgi:endonuclease/exonuclease/phosphatase family metal-dependent hydrolase
MAAKKLSAAQWKKVNKVLDADPARYGMPERVYGSAVLGSFNIRKLGAERKRDDATWQFLGRLCRRIDLLAVQEVMDDLSGLMRLKDEMGPEYHVVVSDKTGAFPGNLGLNERLAFIYRSSLVRRAAVVSDVTYDRSKVHEVLLENFHDISQAVQNYRDKLARFAQGKLKNKPKFQPPVFLSFIRQPYGVSFQLVGHPDTEPYEFMAVNAHLIFGEMGDRKREFNALMDWIIGREKQSTGTLFPGLFLLGDLNLDFDDPATDIGDINKYLQPIANKMGEPISVAFPFLEKHPQQKTVFRTNARQKQTFDHIGLFYRANRVPKEIRERPAGSNPRGPDYGVINFVNLFSKALHGVDFAKLPVSKKKAFYALFEHSVSDHMPIWLRIPLPD